MLFAQRRALQFTTKQFAFLYSLNLDLSMLDIQFIRHNVEAVKKAAQEKLLALDIDKLLELDEQRRLIIGEMDTLRAQRNQMADSMKDSTKRTPELISEGKSIKHVLKKRRALQATESHNELFVARAQHSSTESPRGDASANKVIRQWGEIPKFDFEPRDHMELAKINDWVDFDRGVKVHGYRGYFLKNGGALLLMRLMHESMQQLTAKGYTPIIPPTIVKDFALWGTGMLPFGEGDMFEIGNTAEQESGELIADRLLLAGTSEVGIAGYFANEVLREEDLPLRFVGFSPCYRREVGGYGRDTKGLYRVHEFLR